MPSCCSALPRHWAYSRARACGGEGEGLVSGAGPAGALVGPRADDEGGLLVVGQEPGLEVADVERFTGRVRDSAASGLEPVPGAAQRDRG